MSSSDRIDIDALMAQVRERIREKRDKGIYGPDVEALLRGDVTMVLTIPADFESSLARTGTAPLQLAVNAEKGSAAGIVQSYASTIVANYASELEERDPRSLGRGAGELRRGRGVRASPT